MAKNIESGRIDSTAEKERRTPGVEIEPEKEACGDGWSTERGKREDQDQPRYMLRRDYARIIWEEGDVGCYRSGGLADWKERDCEISESTMKKRADNFAGLRSIRSAGKGLRERKSKTERSLDWRETTKNNERG